MNSAKAKKYFDAMRSAVEGVPAELPIPDSFHSCYCRRCRLHFTPPENLTPICCPAGHTSVVKKEQEP